MGEWKECVLKDVAQYVSDKVTVGGMSVEDYVSTENILPDKGGMCKASGVPSEGVVTAFSKGDVLISNIRPYFKKIWLAQWDGRCSNDVLVLRTNIGVYKRYLYYLLASDDFFAYVMAGSKGTKMPRGDKQQILEYPVLLPSLTTQRRIAAVLGALDDKIEVNRKICENLEAQAQALFKAWFVDFEPFGGKRPEEWKEVELPEVFYFQEGPGIRNWQYVTENGVRFINIRCIVDGDIRVDSANMISEEEAYGKYAHFLLHENDIVMSCSGTLGRYAIVRKDHLPLCLNTSVIRFRPKNGFSDFSWLYGYLGSEEFLSQQKALANGSVQANFGPTHLKNMKVMLPDAVTREKYHQAIYSSIQMAQTIRDENKTLAAMRDALLPKLMAGELAVEKVEVGDACALRTGQETGKG